MKSLKERLLAAATSAADFGPNVLRDHDIVALLREAAGLAPATESPSQEARRLATQIISCSLRDGNTYEYGENSTRLAQLVLDLVKVG